MKPINDFVINQAQKDISAALDRIRREIPIPRNLRYEPNHIFDVDKTVRWNQEEVSRKNLETAQLIRDAYTVRAESEQNLEKAIIKYIAKSMRSNISDDIAKAIIEYAKCMHEDNWYDYLDDCIGFADWIIQKISK